MKYLKTLDLWEPTIQSAIINGQIKLQVDQWLTCGINNTHKCRFVKTNGVTIHVIHWQGNAKETNRKFRQAVQNFYKRYGV